MTSDKTLVFRYIEDYSTWQDWFFPFSDDKSIVLTTNENQVVWTNNQKKGQFITTNQVVHDLIEQSFEYDGISGKSVLKFTTQNKNTEISWTIKGNLSFKWKVEAMLKGGIDDVLGDYLGKSLESIKLGVKNYHLNHTIINNGFITKHGCYYMAIKDSVAIADFDKSKDLKFEELLGFVKANMLTQTSECFVLFNEWNVAKKYVVYKACVPVAEEIIVTTSGNIAEGGELREFLSLKTTLKGSYDFREKAWQASFSVLSESKQYEINSKVEGYIEVYKKTNSENEQYNITEIYMPVAKKTTPIRHSQSSDLQQSVGDSLQ